MSLDETFLGIPVWFLQFLFFVAFCYLIWWLLEPAVKLTKTYPPHPATRHFRDPHDESHHLKPFPSLLGGEPSTLFMTVVAPAYNEQDRLSSFMDETLKYLQQRKVKDASFSYEVLLVNDGSKDRTMEMAMGYVERYGTDVVRVLDMGVNRGKGAAVRQGVMSARGRLIIMVDSDGATRIEDMEKLEEAIHRCEHPDLAVAVGSRAHLDEGTDAVAKRKWYRVFLMKAFHLFVETLCVRNIKDTQCGFKMFTRKAAAAIFPSQHVERWAFDVECLFIAQKLKIPLSEVPVTWTEIDGSHLSIGGVIAMARDVFMIRALYFVGIWAIKKGAM